MKTRPSRIVIAIAILVATPLALLMAIGCLNPAMSYQGVLTDAAGNPVPDGTYTMRFRLLDTTSLPVFTQTTPVSVTNGVFDVILGDLTAPLPVAQLASALQLEIAVEGDVLSPTQPLLGAPYAFTLYPGAVILDDTTSSAALTIQKTTTGPALRLEGGALESDRDSYWWYDANGIVAETASAPLGGSFTIRNYLQGGVRLDCSGPGDDRFVLPLDVPGVLYGQNVWIEEVRVYYRTDDAATYIGETKVLKSTGAGVDEYFQVAHQSAHQTSTTATSYLVETASAGHELSDASGNLVMEFELHCDNVVDNIWISGVRLRLGHE